jgi:DNA helicase-2/ATP-dependent DNA helicase PcrA
MPNYTPRQQEAISTLDRNLQIIACAGSGKTQVISQRIIEILKTGIHPSKIIAFTYTEKAAGELQARILKLCKDQLPDKQGIADMYIGTIHAWCLNALQEYKYEYQKFNVLDEIKLKLFVDKYFKHIGMQDLSMERFKDTTRFIALMSLLREAQFYNRDDVPKNLFEALLKYETELRKHCYFDFTMIMSDALHCLQSDEHFISKISRDIGYLIVDEYQDVNPIQESIVRELYNLGANICVVGDDDQTIFQWRGSHINYIQQFTSRYNNVHSVTLEDNFRSTNAVVDVAIKSISNNNVRLPKIMNARGFQQYERGDILYNQFTSVASENIFIVQKINQLRGIAFKDKEDTPERGLNYSDMVVLVRKWKKAEAIVEAFAQAGIPFVITGINNLFQRLEVRASQAIFQYLYNQIDKGVLKDYWQNLSPLITNENLEKGIDYLDKHIPNSNSYYERFDFQTFFKDFIDIIGVREDIFPSEEHPQAAGYSTAEVIFYNLGMFSKIIYDFETIYYKSDPLYKISAFLNFLTYSASDNYSEGWLNNAYKTPNAVQIMSIYQSKGLEFPVVFVPGLNKNYLPTSQPTGKQLWHHIDRNLIIDVDRYFPSEEDERRLMYVAITRSKKFLIISRAPDGRQQGKESVFGSEVRKSTYAFSSLERDYSERAKLPPTSSSEMENISLNFSLLKSFFECPYRFKFESFYGFQSSFGARIGYGASIHHALMELHREFLEGNIIQKEQLPSILAKHLHFPYAIPFIEEGMIQKAIEAVNTYYDNNLQEFKYIEYAEQDIQLDLGDGIIVNGKMDLIKKRNQDGTIEKTIIDFKSTEKAQEYQATIDQLQLYALGYKALTGENADFLEIYNLDKNEPYRTELTTRDLDTMKEKIRNSANDIRGNNLENTCNDPTCACRFKTTKNQPTNQSKHNN